MIFTHFPYKKSPAIGAFYFLNINLISLLMQQFQFKADIVSKEFFG